MVPGAGDGIIAVPICHNGHDFRKLHLAVAGLSLNADTLAGLLHRPGCAMPCTSCSRILPYFTGEIMNFKLKTAVLAALAIGASGAASAVDISTVAAASILYSSGSTAIDPVLTDYFINSTTNAAICSGSIDVYSSTVTPKFTAIACTANAVTTGLAASTNIAIIKEDNAGSLNGISGLMNTSFAGSPYTTGGLQFPTVSQLANTATFCTTAAKAAGSGLAAYTLHTCGTATTAAKVTPALGFADVEAALFAVSATAPVALTATQTVIVPFAPAVSLGLYHALQSVQGKTVGSELVADMPSLPRSVFSGIYAGQVTSWANVQGTSGNAVSAQSVQFGILSAGATVAGTVWAGTSTATGLTTAPSATAANANVYICRRGTTSGTEKATEWFYNDIGCASLAPYAFLSASSAITTTLCATVATDGCSWTSAIAALNPVVFPGNGTGDLLDCLVGNDQAGHFAVGFASIDNAPGGPSGQQSKTARQNWRYIRIDGTVPSIENTAAGKYDYFAQSFAYAAPTTVTWAATGNAATLLKAITTGNGTGPISIGSPAAVAAVNSGKKWAIDVAKTVSLFNGGALVIPGTTNGAVVAAPNAANATVAAFAANPVSTVFKAKAGAVNNCLRPIVYSTGTQVGTPAYATP